ncbi:RNA polymerase sigma factor [bacterium]|nr:MAG: RNA polymerase sigma factor [bacterium]
MDQHIVSEAELIDRLRQGERPAFDDLFEIYKNKGLAVAYRFTGNLEDAKDALQEAFIKVYLNIGAFKREAKFSTWFYRIVVNCSLDLLRKKKSMGKVFKSGTDCEGKQMDAPDNSYNPQRVALDKELGRDLDICVQELPKNQKACFVLKHQNGFSNEEISGIVGCSTATVKVHIFRALNTLQEKLSGYIGEYAGGQNV